jgi:hypothetical protein
MLRNVTPLAGHDGLARHSLTRREGQGLPDFFPRLFAPRASYRRPFLFHFCRSIPDRFQKFLKMPWFRHHERIHYIAMSVFKRTTCRATFSEKREQEPFSLTPALINKILYQAKPLGHHEAKESLNLGFGFLYYGLVRSLRPKHIVVIGSGYGFSVICLALACISFGCCYGKPLSMCHPFLRLLFRKNYFVFSGKTKKIAYADGLDEEPVIPIQAVTAALYGAAALSGTYLFLSGRPDAAFLTTLLVTQLWRLASEFLRADFRGQNRVSAYQWMSILAIGYTLFLSGRFEDSAKTSPDILAGLISLWNPALLIFLQGLWLALFFFTGRSMVTGSVISVKVIKDRI